MFYYVIGKRTLCLALGVLMLVSCLGFMGLQRTVISVTSAPKALPIYSVETKDGAKKAAIGINCAWGNGDIPDILDSLDQLKVKTTFFLVGDWCEKYPETVKLMHERGHEIGNHSDTHADMAALDPGGIRRELEDCSSKIEAITEKPVDLFRPPSGSYNTEVVITAQAMGYYPIQWDCDSLDWKGLTADEMEARIMKNLKPGSIMLFHNDTEHTAAALPQIIQTIHAEGYELVPVGELIHRDAYTVDHTGRQYLK